MSVQNSMKTKQEFGFSELLPKLTQCCSDGDGCGRGECGGKRGKFKSKFKPRNGAVCVPKIRKRGLLGFFCLGQKEGREIKGDGRFSKNSKRRRKQNACGLCQRPILDRQNGSGGALRAPFEERGPMAAYIFGSPNMLRGLCFLGYLHVGPCFGGPICRAG